MLVGLGVCLDGMFEREVGFTWGKTVWKELERSLGLERCARGVGSLVRIVLRGGGRWRGKLVSEELWITMYQSTSVTQILISEMVLFQISILRQRNHKVGSGRCDVSHVVSGSSSECKSRG